MKYNDILNLNVSDDIKQIYINIYKDVINDDEIILENLRDSLLAAANYNYYTAPVDSNIINKILEPINESLFNDDEIEYLAFINYTIESSDIFLNNPIFNYDSYYEKFNLLNKLVDINDLSVVKLTYYSLLNYDEILDMAYDMFNIPTNISMYIDDNKVIRDYVLSYYNITHTASDNYNYDKSDLFLIRVWLYLYFFKTPCNIYLTPWKKTWSIT